MESLILALRESYVCCDYWNFTIRGTITYFLSENSYVVELTGDIAFWFFMGGGYVGERLDKEVCKELGWEE